jgi:hypothetical protein
MATNPKDSTARKTIGRFARTLLATTCLTVASTGAALASTINIYTEGTPPAPADFPNTGPGTALPGGTIETIVNGHVTLSGDPFDWFEITGLGTGTFIVSAIADSGAPDEIGVYSDSNLTTPLEGLTAFTTSTAANFGALAIPGDGNVVIEIAATNEGSGNYTATLSSAPEPSTIATVALGLAGAFALRRKLRKQ